MATTLSSPLSDAGGCLICQRLALAVVLVVLGNTSKEIIRCFSITARFAGSHRSLQPSNRIRRDCRYKSEEHTSELQSRLHLVCRLLLEKKKNNYNSHNIH